MDSERETPSGASEQGTLSSAPEGAAIAKPGVESGAAAAGEYDISAKPATKAKKKAAAATDELADELEGEKGGAVVEWDPVLKIPVMKNRK